MFERQLEANFVDDKQAFRATDARAYHSQLAALLNRITVVLLPSFDLPVDHSLEPLHRSPGSPA